MALELIIGASRATVEVDLNEGVGIEVVEAEGEITAGVGEAVEEEEEVEITFNPAGMAILRAEEEVVWLTPGQVTLAVTLVVTVAEILAVIISPWALS